MKADVKSLIEAGVHFGHEKRKWDPKMAPYILGEKNGGYIIDIRKTARCLEKACDFLSEVGLSGKGVLFVGTKKQAQRAVVDAAQRCGMYYVRQRWLGGTLTNFVTIEKSIAKLKAMEEAIEKGEHDHYPKKEQARLNRELKRLEKSLGGIKGMKGLPGAVVVIDTQREKIAVAEANRLGIPVVGIVDTKCDPDPIDFVIPANDDAIKAAKVLFGLLAEAVWEGRQRYLKESGLPADEPAAPAAKEVAGGEDEKFDGEEEFDSESDEGEVVVKSAQESDNQGPQADRIKAEEKKTGEWE